MMRKTRTSVMKVASLQPELEFEIIKLVVLRESYIQRLFKKLDDGANSIDMAIIGIFDVLRQVSVEVVETVILWKGLK